MYCWGIPMNLKKSKRKDHFGGKQWKSEYEKFTNKNLSFRIEQKVFLAAVNTIDNLTIIHSAQV